MSRLDWIQVDDDNILCYDRVRSSVLEALLDGPKKK